MIQSMCIAHFIVASSVTACVAFVLLSWVFEFVEYRKKRAQRQKDEPKPKQESETTSKEGTATAQAENEEVKAESSGVSSSTPSIPCLDRLREELSCDICLEIFHEPSTTPCGHSFCKKCLRSAADRCGRKCPKCMEMISNGKCYKVNTVLWNTVQLLFPQEVEARKADTDSDAAAASDMTRILRAAEDLRRLELSSSRGLWPQLAGGGGYVTRPELPGPDRLRVEFREAFTTGEAQLHRHLPEFI